MEAAQRDDFPLLPIVPADFIREHHGVYSGTCVCVWGGGGGEGCMFVICIRM